MQIESYILHPIQAFLPDGFFLSFRFFLYKMTNILYNSKLIMVYYCY